MVSYKMKINGNKIIQIVALPQRQTLTKDTYPFHNIDIVIVQTPIVSISDSGFLMTLRGIGNAHPKVPESSHRELCQIGTL
jgi:hypothetical protein